MLRGDTVKDEEGYRAIFTVLDASAFQMAAERFLDPHKWRSFRAHSSQNGRSTKFVATGKARMPQKFGCGFLHDNDQKVGITPRPRASI